MKRIFSAFLACLFVLSTFPGVFALPVFADGADGTEPALLWDFNADEAMSGHMGENSLNNVRYHGEADADGNEYYVFTAEGDDPFVSVDLGANDVSDILWVKARVKNAGPATTFELFGATDGRGLSGSECTHVHVAQDDEWHTYLIYLPEANVNTVNAFKGHIDEFYWRGTVDWIRLDPLWKTDDTGDTAGSFGEGDKILIDYVAFFPTEEEARGFRTEQDSYIDVEPEYYEYKGPDEPQLVINADHEWYYYCIPGGDPVPALPDGMTFDEETATLTLRNISVRQIAVSGVTSKDGERMGITILLEGENHVYCTPDPYEEPAFSLYNIDAVIKGPGSLNVTTTCPDPNGSVFDVNFSDVTITDGAKITTMTSTPLYEGSRFTAQFSSIHLCGGSTIDTQGTALGGLVGAYSANVLIDDGGTWTCNMFHMYCNTWDPNGDGREGSLTVGEGGLLHILYNAGDFNALCVSWGCFATVDGGTIHIEHEDPDKLYYCEVALHYVWAEGGHVTLNDGEILIDGQYGHDIVQNMCFTLDVSSGGSYRQNGGRYESTGDWAMSISGGASAVLSGGETIARGYNEVVTGASFVVNGGTLLADGETTGSWQGMRVGDGGSFSLLTGSADVRGQCIGMEIADGIVRVLGGKLTLSGSERALYSNNYISAPFTLGNGITALDAGTGEAAVLQSAEYFDSTEYYFDETSVVVQGGGFSAMLSIPAGNPTLGNSFTVLADIVPGGENASVSFTVPDAFALVPGSVTVDGKVCAAAAAGNGFTVPLEGPASVRFTLTAKKEGTYRIDAAIDAGGKRHEESLEVPVAGFVLSLPSLVTKNAAPVSGTAAPGSVVRMYAGDTPIGTATANVLGGWTVKMVFPEAGSYDVRAEITLPDGTVLDGGSSRIEYDPDGLTVSTLTVTNMIHGDRDGEILETKLLIDYVNGTKSANYYTFMPGWGMMNFRVDFTKEDTSSVTCVTVVTTARSGGEIRTPLTRAEDGSFVGSHDYSEYDLPYHFRVEWSDSNGNGNTGDETAPDPGTPDPGTPDPTEPSEEEEGEIYADGTMIVTDGSFTFRLRADGADTAADLADTFALTDAAGDTVGYRAELNVDGTWQIWGNYFRDGLYVAAVDEGASFPDYPDTEELDIIVSGTGSGPEPGHYKYNENVVTVKRLVNAQAEPGTVLVSEEDWSAWVVEDDGSLAEAGLLDVYDELFFTEQDLDPDAEILYDGFLESVQTAVLHSPKALAAVDAINKLAAEKELVEADDDDPGSPILDLLSGEEIDLTEIRGVKIKFRLDEKPNIKKEGASVLLCVGYTFIFTKDLINQDGLGVTLTVEIGLQSKYGIHLQYSLVEEGKEYQYVAESAEDTLNVHIAVVADDNGDEEEKELEDRLKDYFRNEVIREILIPDALEYAQDDEGDDISVDIIKPIYIPIPSVPGVFVTFRMDGGIEFDASGELTFDFSRTLRQEVGIRFDSFMRPKFFYDKDLSDPSAELAFHVSAQIMPYLRAHVGFSVLRCLDLTIYGQIGIQTVFDGHGSTDFSTDGSEIEFYLAQSLCLADGAALRIRLLKNIPSASSLEEFMNSDALSPKTRQRLKKWIDVLGKFEVDITFPIMEMSFKLWETGLKYMPANFSAEDETYAVPGSVDLTSIVDLRLDCLNFEGQFFGKEGKFPWISKEMPHEHYVFAFADKAPEGVTLTKEGQLSISEEALERGGKVAIRVWYLGSNENYRLMKTIHVLYFIPDFTIHKYLAGDVKEGDLPIATFEITDKTLEEENKNEPDPDKQRYWKTEATTGADGKAYVQVPLEYRDHTFTVEETTPPPGYKAVEPTKQDVRVNGSVSFVNERHDQVTPDPYVPPIMDPSGYVYEGSEAFRLYGVTASLYYSAGGEKPTGNADESQLWDAAAFDQTNPLVTDLLGQYQWMVPDGWWQVKYALEGYETVYSDWLPVPPVQTGVNVEMKSAAQAVFSVEEISEDGTVTLRADHPVIVTTVRRDDLTLAVGKRTFIGNVSPLNPNWMEDDRVCATLFRFSPDDAGALAGVGAENVQVYYRNVMTASGVRSENIAPEPPAPKTGDVNGDGSVTVLDRLILTRYLAGWKEYAYRVDEEAADIDRDGKVSAVDRLILSRRLADWDGYDTYFD